MKWLFRVCIALLLLPSPFAAAAQQPPDVVIEENANLISGIVFQKWNVREITEIFQDKNFNGPIIAVLQPGDFVWGLSGDVHSAPNGKILVTRDHQTRSGRLLPEGAVIYPLYAMGNGIYKFWHEGDVQIANLLDIRGMAAGEVRPPAEEKIWGVVLEEMRRPGGQEWWVKVKLTDGRIGWTKDPLHFGNNGLFAYSGISVVIDKHVVVFGTSPIVEKGSVLAPLSTLAEHFNAISRWDERRGMMTLSLDGKEVQLINGSRALVVNGVAKTMDTPTRMLNGRLFVPVRAVAEALGRFVTWDEETRQVLIRDTE